MLVWLLLSCLLADAAADGLADRQTCTLSQPTASRGSVLIQTRQRTRAAPWLNATALQELLPEHLRGAFPQGRPGALPTAWWDPALTRAPIYVEPRWGLSNRLRTIAGAFVAGRKVGRNVVVIWQPTPQCPQELAELFEGIATAPAAPANAYKLEHGRLCEYRVPTPSALEQIRGDQPIFVSACDFSVKGLLEQRHLAFHAMHLQPALRAEVASLVGQLRKPGRRAIAVHIRQGSLQDARQGSFFGKFQRPPASMTELPCCTEQSPSWVCPGHAHPLSSYVKTMRDRAGGAAAVFFVASDRPACIGSLKQNPGSYMTLVHSRLPAMDGSGRNNASAALVDMYALAACEEMLHMDVGSWGGLIHSLHEGFQAAE